MGLNTSGPMEVRHMVDPVLAGLAGTRPLFSSLLEKGDLDLESYTRAFFSADLPALQDRSDYVEQMAGEVAVAQGKAAGERIRTRLQRSPVVNTANHMCLECLPLTVQSMILGALGEEPGGMLPVEACAIIPADNASYPPGLLLARRGGDTQEGKHLRVPILNLSWKLRRQVSWLLEPYQPLDLSRAVGNIAELFHQGSISEAEHRALQFIVKEVLAAPDLLARSTFREQVGAAVPRLWDAWFAADARSTMPGLAYTTAESVRMPLLLRDIRHTGTLAYSILFDPGFRQGLMKALDGIPGCWTDGGRGAGSALFWEVDVERRTHPLTLDSGHLISRSGTRIPLNPEAIAEALSKGTLMPTIFLSMALGLARGLVQIGGFSQIEYQAAMQSGLSRALANHGYSDWSTKLSRLLPPMLTAGLAGVLVQYANQTMQCAGGVELIANGGLRIEDLAKLRSMTLREAIALQLPGISRALLGETPSTSTALPTVNELAASMLHRIPLLRL